MTSLQSVVRTDKGRRAAVTLEFTIPELRLLRRCLHLARRCYAHPDDQRRLRHLIADVEQALGDDDAPPPGAPAAAAVAA